MSTKRIVRSRVDRIIGGVAGGLATHFGVDPLYVRLGFLILSFLNGIGVLLYALLWLLLPNEDSLVSDTRTQVRENVDEMRSAAENLVDRVRTIFNS